MRQIFRSLPYFLPADPDWVRALFLEHGTKRRVAAGETLKRGGESQRLFFLTEGLCAYALESAVERPVLLSLIAPGRAMGDMTASVRERCNIRTLAVRPSTVLIMAPEHLTEALGDGAERANDQIRNVLRKEESIIEGLAANFTLSPEERLKAFFRAAILSDGSEADGEGWIPVPYGLGAETVGETVNLNRVSVSRLLSKWRSDGLLDRRGRTILLKEALFEDLYDWLENPLALKAPAWKS